MRTSFTIAHPASYPHYPMEPPPQAKPGAVQSFVSQPSLHPPTVQVSKSSLSEEIGDVFISPNHGAGQWGPMIIDGAGQLVWFQPMPAGSTAMNLQVDRYEGQPVLVWWHGYLSRLGYGLGTLGVSFAYFLTRLGAGPPAFLNLETSAPLRLSLDAIRARIADTNITNSQ